MTGHPLPQSVDKSASANVHEATASANVHEATASANAHEATASANAHEATASANAHEATASPNAHQALDEKAGYSKVIFLCNFLHHEFFFLMLKATDPYFLLTFHIICLVDLKISVEGL